MKSVVVYCGSSMGRSGVYSYAATQLGLALVDNGINLVYGGGRVGLMGILANTVMRNGGQVVGVIPKKLNVREIENHDVTELIEVETMHERKKIMSDRADAAIVMPGGFGTLDEMFEFLTWTQLGYHQKPLGIYNVNWYYSKLQVFLDISVAEGFIHRDHRKLLLVDEDPQALISKLKAWAPTHGDILAKLDAVPKV